MNIKILIMGLPGSGKTWFAERLQKHLDCAWYNADKVRELANDWDFTEQGRFRQAQRMKSLADFEKFHGRTVICDFVCPFEETRKTFQADFVIFMNTIQKGRFEDTNKMFEKPSSYHIEVTYHWTEEEVEDFANLLREDYYV